MTYFYFSSASRLLLSLTILEHQIQHQKSEVSAQPNTQASGPSASAPASLNSPSPANGDITVSAAQKNSELKYMVGRPIPQQPMFVAAILSALRMQVCLVPIDMKQFNVILIVQLLIFLLF